MDTKGLPLFVMVTPADMTDRNAAKEVLFRLRLMHPEITIVWADSAYAGQLVTWAKAYLNLTIKTVSRPKDASGFVVLPRRWVVERSHAWVMHARRHARDPDTAHPAFGIAHHLGRDHPDDQANHPPKLPQKRTAGIPRSPAGLIVLKVRAITLALPWQGPRSWARANLLGSDPRKDVLESADGLLRLRVFLRTREDSAEGAATISRQGTPAQDRFERVDGTGEEPGQVAVSASEGDGQDGERFPQVFEPVFLRQCLLDIGRPDSFAQASLSLMSESTIARSQLPHLVMDLLLGFLGQHRDDPAHVHAAHSNERVNAVRHGLVRFLTWLNGTPRIENRY